jgi:hypothetical protein
MKVAKKEKRSKKERKGRPVETGAAVEIIKGGLRRLSLDDFHRCLEKPTQKNAPAFPQLPQARRRLTIQQSRSLSFNVSHIWGAVQTIVQFPILNSYLRRSSLHRAPLG